MADRNSIRLPLSAEEQRRYESKVRKAGADECWPWLGCQNGKGYGQLTFRGRGVAAHRFAFMVSHGAIPSGHEVRHRCDNRACCNPNHLHTGTHLENIRDAVQRQRTARVIPSDQTVLEMRRLYLECGVKQKDLAVMFGVGKAAVSSAIRGKNWRHLGIPTEAELKKAANRTKAPRFGDDSPKAKLKESDIPEIRRVYASGVRQREIAKSYGVHVITISQVVTRKTWRHVP